MGVELFESFYGKEETTKGSQPGVPEKAPSTEPAPFPIVPPPPEMPQEKPDRPTEPAKPATPEPAEPNRKEEPV